MTEFWISLLPSAIRLSTPLTLAALGGYFSERSGVINIGLEGFMLIGAFAGAAGNYYFESVWAGYLCAVGASIILSGIHAFASISLKANQVVSGMALNIFAYGAAALLSHAIFQTSGTTPSIQSEFHVGYLGPFTPLVYVALASVLIAHLWTYHTKWGLRFRAVGDAPEAADSLGVSVIRTRIMGVCMSGLLCGLAGAFLSMEHAAAYSRNMTAGRGYLALTALIFGQWRPIPTFLACCLFGLTDALQIRLQGAELPGIGVIAPQFIQIIPYITALLVLATFVGTSSQPKALGKPFSRN